MSPRELADALDTLGWSARWLSARTGYHQNTIAAWLDGRSPVPSDLADTIRALVQAHNAHPLPTSRFAKPRPLA